MLMTLLEVSCAFAQTFHMHSTGVPHACEDPTCIVRFSTSGCWGFPQACVWSSVCSHLRFPPLQLSGVSHALPHTACNQENCVEDILGTALLWKPNSHSAEPVVAVAAVPPALGDSHPLHIMLPALRPPVL